MYTILHDDCLNWMKDEKKNSIMAVVTDPPYAFQEYSPAELEKKRNGVGGIWRLPPSFDGSKRQALPRFSVINDDAKMRTAFINFFSIWGAELFRILTPGAHLIIATTPLLSDLLGGAMRSAGFERRGELVRLVSTLRGGDRPKGAEAEFLDVSVMPRAGWEPWGVYRKPISEKTVAQNLRKWGTGALRRPSPDSPFYDVLPIGRTSKKERQFSNHPSQKPLELMCQLTRASLPLGTGVLLDPFIGSGSTIAASAFQNITSIGIERDRNFYEQSLVAVPDMINFLKKQTIDKKD